MRKILIVEDDKVLNKTLAYNLTADGYEVASAYSFQDAVERLKKSEFDIALLDINLCIRLHSLSAYHLLYHLL